MFVLIPMDGMDRDDSSIAKLDDARAWVQLCIEEGEVSELVFSEERESFENFSEVLIVTNDNEYVWPFIEQNMMILVAHTQKSIDDIVEAFLFRELNELAY